MPVVRHRLGALTLAGLLLVVALPGVAASPDAMPGSQAGAPGATDGAAPPASGHPALNELLRGASAAGDRLRSTLTAFAASASSAAGERSTIAYGEDGRLTILLLGSDHREDYKYQEHTDVIMVVSLDPVRGKIAMASIPRSTVRFPLHPDNRTAGGPKTSGDRKINVLYGGYKKGSTDAIEPAALDRLRMDVAHALRLEIDYYSYIRFTGFDAMVDAAGGIRVDIPASIVDPYYQDSGTPPFGIRFSAATDRLVKGASATRCSGTINNCKRAIVYVRSRKGTVGSARNSDYQRARRQQALIFSAIGKVTSGGADLETLRSGSISHITTDMPRTAADALWLRDQLTGARSPDKARVVFADPTWATKQTVPKDSTRLHMTDVRAWIAQKMAPVGTLP